jgi:hypothetical protein
VRSCIIFKWFWTLVRNNQRDIDHELESQEVILQHVTCASEPETKACPTPTINTAQQNTSLDAVPSDEAQIYNASEEPVIAEKINNSCKTTTSCTTLNTKSICQKTDTGLTRLRYYRSRRSGCILTIIHAVGGWFLRDFRCRSGGEHVVALSGQENERTRKA